jgi:GNAT superfamily N-acetyltransferase
VSTGPISKIKNSAAPEFSASVPKLLFEGLSGAIPRGLFNCGDKELDKWFQSARCLSDHDGHLQKVTCVFEENSGDLVGFFSLSLKIEKVSNLKNRPAYIPGIANNLFPSMHLCALAVDRSRQGRGYGRIIMGRVMNDFYHVVIRTGIFALTLNALNKDVATFYKKLGFDYYGPITSQPSMLISSEAAIDLEEGGNAAEKDE